MTSTKNIFHKSQLKAQSGTRHQGLHRDAPTPLYYRLYSLIKSTILEGTLERGAQIPTEQQLGETFGVSRITAKRALDELAAEGLVERKRGKGTHVIYQYSPKPVQAPLVGMLEEIESMARHSDVKVLKCTQQVPPTEIRARLSLDEKEKALMLVRVRSRDGQPFGYYVSWTGRLKKTVTKSDFQKNTRLAIFRKQGLKITHVTQTISAVAATIELAKHLRTNPGAPLISLTRQSFETRRGTEHLVDELQVYYHPERFQYQMDLRLDK